GLAERDGSPWPLACDRSKPLNQCSSAEKGGVACKSAVAQLPQWAGIVQRVCARACDLYLNAAECQPCGSAVQRAVLAGTPGATVLGTHMLFGAAAARLRACLRFAGGLRAAAGAIAFTLAFAAAAPAWSACLTSTLVLAAPPYTNSQCITPPADNDGIQATGSTYTLNNSGDITVQSTVAKALPTAAIN